MKRLAKLFLFLIPTIFVSSLVLSAQGWQDDQDGDNFAAFDILSLQVNNLAGTGTRCVQTSSTGALSPTASACVSGTVTGVAATPPLFIVGGASPTPNVTIQGAIVSGSTSTAAQNLGSISTAPLVCSTSAGVCTVTGGTVAGGLAFNTGTGATTLGSFTCGAHTFMSSTTTAGAVCTQPVPSDLFVAANSIVMNPTISAANATAVSVGTGSGVLHLFTPAGPNQFVTVAIGTKQVAYGSGTNGQLTSSANFTYDSAAEPGSIALSNVTAPGTPAAGVNACYPDSASKNWACKNDVGLVNHGIQTQTCGAHQWISAISDGGGTACVQPSYADLSGSAPTKHDFTLQASVAAGQTNCGLLPGGNGFGATCATYESPNDFVAGHVQYKANFPNNPITGGSLAFHVTMNGSAVAGTTLTFTSASATGVFVVSAQPTGSTLSTDTFGMAWTTSAGYAGVFPTVIMQMVLTP